MTGMCKNQSVCHMHGYGSWDHAYKVCPLLHPATTMIDERSLDVAEYNVMEASKLPCRNVHDLITINRNEIMINHHQ